jgi:hypothetical protein
VIPPTINPTSMCENTNIFILIAAKIETKTYKGKLCLGKKETFKLVVSVQQIWKKSFLQSKIFYERIFISEKNNTTL